ncbi:MAG: hypothetical protein GY913_00725 [Proteobacteria bacterium]|nr:hypothetical protein [Pseudomonadota bacterium]
MTGELDGAWLNGAEYAVEWDLDGPLWSVENDLGWTVTVTDGELVDYSVSLVQCADLTKGHGDEADESTSPEVVFEDLALLGVADLGGVDFTPASYCQAHVLVASDSGPSLTLAGTAASGFDEGEFLITTDEAYGALYDLDLDADDEILLAEVTLSRTADTLFEGLDFLALEDPGWTVLENLFTHQEVELALVPHIHEVSNDPVASVDCSGRSPL